LFFVIYLITRYIIMGKSSHTIVTTEPNVNTLYHDPPTLLALSSPCRLDRSIPSLNQTYTTVYCRLVVALYTTPLYLLQPAAISCSKTERTQYTVPQHIRAW
jgi:hypothetical protein